MPDSPEKPLCEAVPDLPAFLQFNPCTLPAHDPTRAHRVVQDGLVITWDSWTVDALRVLLGIDR